MQRNKSLLHFLTVVIILTVVVGTGIAASFSIGVSDSVETPERTVDNDAIGEHTVDAVAVTNAGGAVTVDVTVPSEGIHFLDLYKEDRIDTVRLNDGPETVEISTDGLEPGSYILRLRSDGTTEDIFPVVIAGYDVTTTQPESVEMGTEATVEVTLEEGDQTGEPGAGVEVVVWNDDTAERIETTQSGDLTYTATIDSSQLDETTYKIYAIAQSDEEYQGENEIVGMSRNAELTVEPNTTDDGSSDDGTSDDDSSDDSTSDDSETNDDSTTDDSDSNSTDNDSTDDSETNDDSTTDDSDNNSTDEDSTDDTETNDDSTADDDADDADDGSSDSADGGDDSDGDGDGSSEDESTDGEEDNSSVIEPNTDNESNQDDSDTTNDDGTVPLSMWTAVVAIVAGVLALRSTLEK